MFSLSPSKPVREEVLVEVLGLRPHAADVEAELLLEGHARSLEVVGDDHHDRGGDVEVGHALAGHLREARAQVVEHELGVVRVEAGQQEAVAQLTG